MIFRSYFIVLAALLLSGCANTPNMKAMSPSTRTDCFVLTEQMTYSMSRRFGYAPLQFGLFADTYRPKLEDSEAIYYGGVGDGYFVGEGANQEELAKSKVQRHPGGIRISKKPGVKPALYINEDLSGRPIIEYNLALQHHQEAKAGRNNEKSVPLQYRSNAPYTPAGGTGSIAAGALGNAIGNAVVSSILAGSHGRILVLETPPQAEAFWTAIESKRTTCPK